MGERERSRRACWVVNIREVTDRKLFEDELRRQAATDPLTGLLNRTAFSERLIAATAAIDPAAPPAVLFVDIDDFKTVNDTLGHSAGDELLVTVAARLTAGVRAEDVVARLGGDEFAVLLTWADGERLRDVADRMLTALRAPMEVAGTDITVTGACQESSCSFPDPGSTICYGRRRGGPRPARHQVRGAAAASERAAAAAGAGLRGRLPGHGGGAAGAAPAPGR